MSNIMTFEQYLQKKNNASALKQNHTKVITVIKNRSRFNKKQLLQKKTEADKVLMPIENEIKPKKSSILSNLLYKPDQFAFS